MIFKTYSTKMSISAEASAISSWIECHNPQQFGGKMWDIAVSFTTYTVHSCVASNHNNCSYTYLAFFVNYKLLFYTFIYILTLRQCLIVCLKNQIPFIIPDPRLTVRPKSPICALFGPHTDLMRYTICIGREETITSTHH